MATTVYLLPFSRAARRLVLRDVVRCPRACLCPLYNACRPSRLCADARVGQLNMHAWWHDVTCVTCRACLAPCPALNPQKAPSQTPSTSSAHRCQMCTSRSRPRLWRVLPRHAARPFAPRRNPLLSLRLSFPPSHTGHPHTSPPHALAARLSHARAHTNALGSRNYPLVRAICNGVHAGRPCVSVAWRAPSSACGAARSSLGRSRPVSGRGNVSGRYLLVASVALRLGAPPFASLSMSVSLSSRCGPCPAWLKHLRSRWHGWI